MSNTFAAVILAAFVLGNALAYSRRPGVEGVMFFFLTLPVLGLAAKARAPRKSDFNSFPAKSPASLFPYFLSLLIVTAFTIYIYLKVTRKTVTFVWPILINNWSYQEGLLLLCLSAGAGACGLVIHTSGLYNRFAEKGGVDRLYLPEMFYAGSSELVRFVVYFTALLFLWAAPVEIMRFYIGDWPFQSLVISMGRAAMPLMLLLAGALIRLMPFSIWALIALAGEYLLAYAVVGELPHGKAIASIFVVVPLALLVPPLAVRYITVGRYLPVILSGNKAAKNSSPDKQ